MSNPLRLREMQERNGIKPKKDKAEKRREKHEKKKALTLTTICSTFCSPCGTTAACTVS